MDTAMAAIVPLVVLLVAGILVAGLWNMMRGGPGNRSQTLMRARVVAQFGAIVIIMGTLWLLGR